MSMKNSLFFVLFSFYFGYVFAQPVNDDCSAAIVISSGTACTNSAGSNAGVVSVNFDACIGLDKRNVWYKFTAASSTQSIRLTLGTITNAILDVYDANCATLTPVGSNCNFTQPGPVIDRVLSGLTVGNEYLIAISTIEQFEEGSFNICVFTTPPPANDDCGNAVALSVHPSNIPAARIAGTTLFGTQGIAGCSGTADDDVWYVFTATQNSHRLFLRRLTIISPEAQIFSGTCGSPVSVQCIAGTFNSLATSSAIMNGLTPGSTYFIRVYSSGSSSSDMGSFEIAITGAPLNNECAGATAVTPSANGSDQCTTSAAGSTFDATQSSPDCFGGSSTSNDTWYKFVATQAVHKIKIFGFGGTAIRFQTFSGTCGALISQSCNLPTFSGDTAIQSINQLVAGDTYFLRVYSGGVQGLFNVCITSPFFPANDACTNAAVLVPSADTTFNFTGGSLKGATGVNLAGTCGVHLADVWYRFTATAVQHIIKARNITNTSDIGIELFLGSCGSLVHMRCKGGNDSLFAIGNLTMGQEYFIRLYTGSTFFFDDFRIGVFTPGDLPPNDECATATVLTPAAGNTCNETAGTTIGATQSVNDNCDGNALMGVIKDVWYRFTATASSHRIRLMTGTAAFLRYKLYTGSCAGLTAILCIPQIVPPASETEQRFNGLIIGNTYFIRVFNLGTNAQGTFDICVKTVEIPANDNCTGAVVLTPQANVTFGTYTGGTTTDATASSQAEVCFFGRDDDVWYSFTATEVNMKVFLQNGTIGTTAIIAYSGTCPAALTALFCASGSTRDNIMLMPNLTVGTTYSVRVYSTSTTGSQGTFSIIVTGYTPPINDNCINAVTLVPSSNNICSFVQGTLIDAGSSGTADCVSGFDVWFKFVAAAPAHRINIEGFVNAPGVSVLSGTCAVPVSVPATCAIGNAATVSVTAAGLTIGNTYFIKVFHTSGAFRQSIFNICITTPQVPVNDLCVNASGLVVASDASAETSGLHSTNLAGFSGPANCVTNANDVWFSFTAPATPVIAEVIALTGDIPINPVMELFSGSCASLTSVTCNGIEPSSLNNILNLNNLVAGNTYLLRVSGTSSVPMEFHVKVYKALSPKINGSIDSLCILTNLVTRPGFDIDFSYPTSFTGSATPGSQLIPGWRIPTRGTPDAFNALNTTSSPVEIPNNLCVGNQSPRNGYGYAGLFAYLPSGSREYLEGELSAPLVPGKQYLVSMYVSLADFSTVSIDNIGISLRTSRTQVLNFLPLNFTPQLTSPDNVFLSDKQSWVNVSAIITADQAYQFLVIGNFKTNAATDTIRVADPSGLLSGGTFPGCATLSGSAYYFIDDVMISEVDNNAAGCNLLPLRLLTFTGEKDGEKVKLNWRTVNEQNSSRFEVQRSSDGSNFKQLGTVPAKNIPGNHSYWFDDDRPLKGINYYRLKQIDTDGRFTLSQIVRINVGNIRTEFEVYPNPVTDKLMFRNFTGSSVVRVRIIDARGSMVHEQFIQVVSNPELDVRKLQKGFYLLEIIDGKKRSTVKFLKQ